MVVVDIVGGGRIVVVIGGELKVANSTTFPLEDIMLAASVTLKLAVL